MGIGFAQHAGQVIPPRRGTPEADERLKRVLYNDPLMGIFRHVDAGYEVAEECAVEYGVNIPTRKQRKTPRG